jgi:hypothetical protein
MPVRYHSRFGFSRRELLIVIAVISVGVAFLGGVVAQRQKRKAIRTACVFNLKSIGIADRIWSEDHGGRLPKQCPTKDGGWQELLTQTNAGQYCGMNYSLLLRELAESPVIVVCPADRDRRKPATNFDDFGNANSSYLIGAGATTIFPNSIIAGDRNLAPGLEPQDDYGFSKPEDTGNDVILSTNASMTPVCWSLRMHSYGNRRGAGNILLGDGSVKQCDGAQFRNDYQSHAVDSGNFPQGYFNQSNSFRLIFP